MSDSRPPRRFRGSFLHPDAVRLLAFIVSVMLLFLAARQGQSQAVMYAAFGGFLVVATFWVHGLDINWVELRADFRNKWLLLGALALPVVTSIVIGLRLESLRSTLTLGVLISSYVAAGLGIRKLRWLVLQDDSAPDGRRFDRAVNGVLRVAFRWQVLLATVLLAYGSLWLLGRAPTWFALVALGLTVAPVPALLGVISERRIMVLTQDTADPRLRWWIGAGAAVVILSVVIGVISLSQTRYLLALVVVVALLTWAITVGSLADIAAALAVLALMGVTPGSQEVKTEVLSVKATTPKAGSEPVIVSLGDSYSSGEGAARYLDETNVAGGNQCRRAATAWPVLVAQSLGAHRLVFRACSGARARNLVGTPADDEQYPEEGIQVTRALDEVRTADPGLDPSLVLLSIGGNDAGFRQIGSSCLSLGSCNDDGVTRYFLDNLADVEAALRATYVAIADRFPDSPIAVMPYPDAFATDDGCARAPVESGDITFVRRFTGQLDGVIEKVATETGLYYVGPMRTALADSHLALCDGSGTPGLNFLDLRGVGGAAQNRFNPGNWIHNSLHPNERGHAALATAFTGWLSAQTLSTGGGQEVSGLAALLPPAAKRTADGVEEPPAGLPVPSKKTTTLCFEQDGGDCGPKADAWALRRLAPGATLPLILLLVCAGGSWAMSVGISAARFRRRYGPAAS